MDLKGGWKGVLIVCGFVSVAQVSWAPVDQDFCLCLFRWPRLAGRRWIRILFVSVSVAQVGWAPAVQCLFCVGGPGRLKRGKFEQRVSRATRTKAQTRDSIGCKCLSIQTHLNPGTPANPIHILPNPFNHIH